MIELQNVTKRFGDITALDAVSLSVEQGRSLALIGATAAGKSVLLKLIAGLYAPENGVIQIDGAPQVTVDERAQAMNLRIGMLFQHNALFDSLTVWENIAFRLMQNGLSRQAGRARAIELLQQVGLAKENADLFPADLSGGMQKRVGFARAIATDADILLLDNPTAGLDPILAARIDRMISQMARDRGATVISVTSNMVGLYEAYDDVAVLDRGQLHWFGTSEQARTDPNPYLRQIIEGHREGPIKVMAS